MLTLLALSLSTANGALSLPTRQLSSALESIQQSNKKSLTHKKSLIRALQLEDLDAEDQACLFGIIGALGEDDNPLATITEEQDYYDSCDFSTGIGICDFSDSTVECDESAGKTIFNDMLVCKEDVPEGDGQPFDMVMNNIPFCFPKICPEDANFIEMMLIFFQIFAESLEGLAGNETTPEDTVDLDMLEALGKQQCDSGTKLSDYPSTDHSHSHDSRGDTPDTSDASVRNMILSFSVAAAMGIGAFLTV